MKKIPLLDLQAQYDTIKNEIDSSMQAVISKQQFVKGKEVAAFEDEFAAFIGEKTYCASCGNGTDALFLALKGLGIGPGDEVIFSTLTFIATAEAITLVGAQPVFVDIDEKTMLIDPAKAEKAITKNTKAIIAVHLYGQPCNMTALSLLAKKNGLFLIEDAAQAHGARWNGNNVGTLGDVACFSFFPGKNLGAYGDGGAVVSQNQGVIEHIKAFANHGRITKYEHLFPGTNSRLDELQAAVLRVKLRHLHAWNELRRKHAAYYFAHLKGVTLPTIDPRAESVFHLFVIRSDEREELQTYLNTQNIATGIHYPIPLHQQPAYKDCSISLPIAEKVVQQILSIPLYPELKKEEQEYIVNSMNNSYTFA